VGVRCGSRRSLLTTHVTTYSRPTYRSFPADARLRGRSSDCGPSRALYY
jgi:hypothetical protein